MSEILFLDVETRSACDLRKAGANVYFEDPSTDLIVACWALDDGELQTWWPGQPCPPAIVEHVRAGRTVSGWNVVGFEEKCWRALLGPRYGWPMPRLEQFDDTAAMAAAMALPRDLGSASQALGLEVQKDQEGHALMMRMSRPRTREPLTWWTEPDKLERLAQYCRTDVATERAARRRLVPLSAAERDMWLLDARINQRGIGIDTTLCRAMMQIVDEATARLNGELAIATGGNVSKASKVAKLTEWLQAEGLEVGSLAKAALADLLRLEDLPAEVRRALEIRQEAAKASTSKLKAALACTGRDGRARGLTLYHGASTGRWTGKLFQPHNLPRGSGVVKDGEEAAPYMRLGSAEVVSMLYGRPLAAVSDCLRSVIAAAPGRDLLAADYSAIEGRVTAWLSGETWKLDAFRANDAGTGAGMYELTAAGIFDVAVERVTKGERQVGKVAELALGFAGGVAAFYSMALNYPDVKMEQAFAPLWAAADEKRREKAVARYERCLKRREAMADKMSREAWIASELTKTGWRAKHPATVAAWAALEDGARAAVDAPGQVVSVLGGKIAFRVALGFLWLRLPGGRCLCYATPKLRQQVWGRALDVEAGFWSPDSEIMPKDAAEILARRKLFLIERPARAAVTAVGVDSKTRKWSRFALYSGLIMENAVQATARDVMASGMVAVEAAGYPVVLTVHDEVVAEPDEGFGSLEEFTRLLCALPPVYEDLPIAASGWRGKRYRKD